MHGSLCEPGSLDSKNQEAYHLMLIAAGDCGVVYSCTLDHTHDNIYQAHPSIFDESLEEGMGMGNEADWMTHWSGNFLGKCEKYVPDAEDMLSYVSLDQLLNNTYTQLDLALCVNVCVGRGGEGST